MDQTIEKREKSRAKIIEKRENQGPKVSKNVIKNLKNIDSQDRLCWFTTTNPLGEIEHYIN